MPDRQILKTTHALMKVSNSSLWYTRILLLKDINRFFSIPSAHSTFFRAALASFSQYSSVVFWNFSALLVVGMIFCIRGNAQLPVSVWPYRYFRYSQDINGWSKPFSLFNVNLKPAIFINLAVPKNFRALYIYKSKISIFQTGSK